jgi:hypothetical protein
MLRPSTTTQQRFSRICVRDRLSTRIVLCHWPLGRWTGETPDYIDTYVAKLGTTYHAFIKSCRPADASGDSCYCDGVGALGPKRPGRRLVSAADLFRPHARFSNPILRCRAPLSAVAIRR